MADLSVCGRFSENLVDFGKRARERGSWREKGGVYQVVGYNTGRLNQGILLVCVYIYI